MSFRRQFFKSLKLSCLLTELNGTYILNYSSKPKKCGNIFLIFAVGGGQKLVENNYFSSALICSKRPENFKSAIRNFHPHEMATPLVHSFVRALWRLLLRDEADRHPIRDVYFCFLWKSSLVRYSKPWTKILCIVWYGETHWTKSIAHRGCS